LPLVWRKQKNRDKNKVSIAHYRELQV